MRSGVAHEAATRRMSPRAVIDAHVPPPYRQRSSRTHKTTRGCSLLERHPDRRRDMILVRAARQLFSDDLPELREDTGYRGPTACSAAGITYRQLDYWARTGLVEPRSDRRRLGHAAALQLPRPSDPQGDQAPDRRRHLAAADPHRDQPPSRARRRGPRPDHADERRRHRLRVHLRRRGRRPAPGRPGACSVLPGRVAEIEGVLAPPSSERADGEAPTSHPGDELTPRRAARLIS